MRIAILSDSPSQFLSNSLQTLAAENGWTLEVKSWDYEPPENLLLSQNSPLFKFQPEYVLFFFTTQKLAENFYQLPLDERTAFADNRMASLENYCHLLQEATHARIIVNNFPVTRDPVFGNYANKIESSLLFQLRKINYRLMQQSQENSSISVNDLAGLITEVGHRTATDSRFYVNADLSFAVDFYKDIAKNILDIMLAANGIIKKCLVLDLDNTLWGGIIGDDGWENIELGNLGIGKAFSALQLWIRELKQRGIILAVCSKNFEDTAKEPFLKHPDMVLSLEDISVFVANWDNKVTNLQHIQQVLNIGFDSMVLLDDNPVERAMVKKYLPEITIPDLPEDPADYLPYLQQLNLFETASYSGEDSTRTRTYRDESERVKARKAFTDDGSFLQSLQMEAAVEAFNDFNIPRVAQLFQRSNQFNLRTIRYSEEEIKKISSDANYLTLSFSLKDQYGQYGIISLVIIKCNRDSLFIENWVMSCRVLGRSMEEFVMNIILEKAVEIDAQEITGECLPTAKNKLVADLYERLGFVKEDGKWLLDVKNAVSFPTFVQRKHQDSK